MRRNVKFLALALGRVVALSGLNGCDSIPSGGGGGSAKVMTILTADDSVGVKLIGDILSSNKMDVPLDDMESFTIVVPFGEDALRWGALNT